MPDTGKEETADLSKTRETLSDSHCTTEAASLSGIRYPLSGIASPFASFLRFSDWLHATLRRTHQIALQTIAQGLFDFLTVENHASPEAIAAALTSDWSRTHGREALQLRGMPATPAPLKPAAIRAARRQARHTQAL